MEEQPKINPAELIEQAKAGSASAYGTLYEAYFTPIYRYIYLRTKSKEEAENLTQEVFIKIYNSLKSYRNVGKNPLAYFFTVARNTIIDYSRKNKNQSASIEEEILENVPDENSSPVKDTQQNELAAKLRSAIKTLNQDQQDVIILKYIDGLPNREIAELLGKSQEAIRQIQCRSLKHLRQIENLYE